MKHTFYMENAQMWDWGDNYKALYPVCKEKGIRLHHVNSVWVLESNKYGPVYDIAKKYGYHPVELSGDVYDFFRVVKRQDVDACIKAIRMFGGLVTSVSECYENTAITADIPVEFRNIFG